MDVCQLTVLRYLFDLRDVLRLMTSLMVGGRSGSSMVGWWSSMVGGRPSGVSDRSRWYRRSIASWVCSAKGSIINLYSSVVEGLIQQESLHL